MEKQMNIERWFPTPVIWHDAPQALSASIQSDFFSKEAEIKQTLKDNAWGDNISSSFAFGVDFISEFNLHELGNFIDGVVHELAKAFNIHGGLTRKESWVNYQNKYQ